MMKLKYFRIFGIRCPVHGYKITFNCKQDILCRKFENTKVL